MRSHTWRAVVITLSDSCAAGEREDLSGQALAEGLATVPLEVVEKIILPDDYEVIKKTLVHYASDPQIHLIVTTGGTGLSPRDVTPEATLAILEKNVPGIAEWLRAEGMKKNNRAALSRSVAGIRNQTLIINLPGSVKAVNESMESLRGLLPHALETLAGKVVRCGD
jgi:molybdopterin adenylyltransferase